MGKSKQDVNILFLCDEEMYVESVAAFLSHSLAYNFKVDWRANYDELPKAVNDVSKQCDIILVDLDLIEIERSIQSFRKMIKDAKKIPVIVFTNKSDHDLALLAMEAGASDNVSKESYRADVFKVRDSIEFALIRSEREKEDRRQSERLIRDARMDAEAELHSVRKSIAYDRKLERDELAEIVKRVIADKDKALAGAVVDISEALLTAQLDNDLLSRRLESDSRHRGREET